MSVAVLISESLAFAEQFHFRSGQRVILVEDQDVRLLAQPFPSPGRCAPTGTIGRVIEVRTAPYLVSVHFDGMFDIWCDPYKLAPAVEGWRAL